MKTILSLESLAPKDHKVDRPQLVTEITHIPVNGEFVPLIKSRTLSRHIFLTELGVSVKIGIEDGRKFGMWLRDMKRNQWEIGSRYDPIKKTWAVERKYFHVVNEWLLQNTEELSSDLEHIIPIGKIVRWKEVSEIGVQTVPDDEIAQVPLKKRRILRNEIEGYCRKQ